MIFNRSIPPFHFRNYIDYRPILRQDFQYRCAYCLMHEYFLGGEAGCCIDHHRPMTGSFARPDLIVDYSNLFWCCRECNENKSNSWPPPEDYNIGLRFLDPCQPEDDHNLHWRIDLDGVLVPLTPTGLYTDRKLKLWRPFLQQHREKTYRLQEELNYLVRSLRAKHIPDAQRILLEKRLEDTQQWLDPPIYDRPRNADNNSSSL